VSASLAIVPGELAVVVAPTQPVLQPLFVQALILNGAGFVSVPPVKVILKLLALAAGTLTAEGLPGAAVSMVTGAGVKEKLETLPARSSA
jgi:hypothetical protein